MQVIPGGLGSEKGISATARFGRRASGRPRDSHEGSAERAPEAPHFRKPHAPERPPRAMGGSSEIVMLDAQGVIVVVNQTWRSTLESYAFALPDAGVGLSYVEVACRFLPDLDRAALELSIGRLLTGEVDEVRRTYAIKTPDGPRWRQVHITPLSIGVAGRFVAIHDDLTDLAVATSEQLLAARDEERERIAIELHDSTLQHLAVISFGLSRLKRASPGEEAATILKDMSASLDEALKETRVLSYLMKPRGLARNGLSATVRQFLEGFAKRTGLQVTLEADVAVDRAPQPLQHAALRIIQEALTNANRHAHAQRIEVELCVHDGQLTVSVADDGRGIPTDRNDPALGVGIPGMQARAQQFAGEVEIESDIGGTRITAWLPLAAGG